MTNDSRTLVSVCVCTYQRPRRLKKLLLAIDGQESRRGREEWDLEVVIVDNDPDGSARRVADRYSERSRWSVKYSIEECPGIPAARNRTLQEINDETDYIAMIDDDEWPSAMWIDNLLHGLRQYDADVSHGPVIPVYGKDVPDWVIEGGFFTRRRYATGTRSITPSTGNVLFDRSFLTSLNSWFDTSLTFLGGSDTEFFLRIQERGAETVWIDSAAVFENVESSRTRARWIIQRRFRLGVNEARGGAAEESFRRQVLRAVGGVWHLFRALIDGISSVRGVWGGKNVWVEGLADAAGRVGFVCGLFGCKYEEYARD